MTRKYNLIYRCSAVFSALLNIFPLAWYVCLAFASSSLVLEKIALSATVLAVLIMTMISIINKTAMRSRVWVLVLGLYFCLDNFIEPILVVSITQVVDELFMCPLKKWAREKYVINKEIDKR